MRPSEPLPDRSSPVPGMPCTAEMMRTGSSTLPSCIFTVAPTFAPTARRYVSVAMPVSGAGAGAFASSRTVSLGVGWNGSGVKVVEPVE
ncbi:MULTISPECIES: hypothetical protein [unclassified Streptomyces]|uniref:hypothetical protein n=1 Tax=unclassified Streptomyces TaxID=2593676 RepID=UPI001F35395D|nr:MULTISPECIES: hypothetical protein [unclassified Streptomyces]